MHQFMCPAFKEIRVALPFFSFPYSVYAWFGFCRKLHLLGCNECLLLTETRDLVSCFFVFFFHLLI